MFIFEDYSGAMYTNTQTMAVVDVYFILREISQSGSDHRPGEHCGFYEVRTKIVPRVRP